MSKSEKWQKRRHSLKCYNGSATNHKTREGMPCGDYSTERSDTQILFGEALGFFDQRTPEAAAGDDLVQLYEGT